MSHGPQLSAALVSLRGRRAELAGTTMLETARLYDRVGIDRLVISDHVVFGEHLDAYGTPRDRRRSAAAANPPVPTATGSSR